MPPAPTLAARMTPGGSHSVTENLAAAPPTDNCALPPPPPVSVAVTVQPLGGAKKREPVGAEVTLSEEPAGRTETGIKVGLGGSVCVLVGLRDGVCVGLGVGDGDGVVDGQVTLTIATAPGTPALVAVPPPTNVVVPFLARAVFT